MSVEGLTKAINPSQLTPEFGGTLAYEHDEWIEVRIAFEHFIWDALNILDKFNEIEVKVVVDNYAPDPDGAKVCFNFDFVISIIQPVS